MITRATRFLATLLVAACFSAAAIAAAAPAEKWRLQLYGQATSDGELHLRLTPQGGDAIVVTVKIHSGRGELYMAKDLLAALRAQLPGKRFRSQIVHGDQVLVKAGHDEAPFALEFIDSSVGGTKLKLGPG